MHSKPQSKLIRYQTEDGQTHIGVFALKGRNRTLSPIRNIISAITCHTLRKTVSSGLVFEKIALLTAVFGAT